MLNNGYNHKAHSLHFSASIPYGSSASYRFPNGSTSLRQSVSYTYIGHREESCRKAAHMFVNREAFLCSIHPHLPYSVSLPKEGWSTVEFLVQWETRINAPGTWFGSICSLCERQAWCVGSFLSIPAPVIGASKHNFQYTYLGALERQ